MVYIFLVQMAQRLLKSESEPIFSKAISCTIISGCHTKISLHTFLPFRRPRVLGLRQQILEMIKLLTFQILLSEPDGRSRFKKQIPLQVP